MSYNSDVIIADTEEMEVFLDVAVEIARELGYQLTDIEKKFRVINNWEDDISEKVDEVLEKINQKCDVVFEGIDKLNNTFRDYLDILEDYNNPFSGRLGRL